MKKPNLPSDENLRVAALHRLNILDTGAEERFDRITRIVQQHFDCAVTLINLIDEQRQWFKSRQGMLIEATSRDASFCGHTILAEDILAVPDTLTDDRFVDNPWVVDTPHIRSYAGTPLHAPHGERVGTLCIMDTHVQHLSDSQARLLRDLADIVESELSRTCLLKAANEAYQNEQRIRDIIDTVVDGIITIDSQAMVHVFNPAAQKIFGYTAEEVIGQNIKMLVPAPHQQVHDTYVQKYLDTRQNHIVGMSREVTGQRKNGSVFPMDLAVNEMPVNGEIMFTAIVRDISERKRLDSMKSEFVSTVSHELRTPLTSIRGALGLVLGKAASHLPAKVLKMLQMAERNSERLTLLINDILDLEKIESGRLDFDLVVVDLATLAQQAQIDNQGYAAKHQVTLTLDRQVKSALVYADSHRLLQVFANLISNAVKYSPEHGVVEIIVMDNDEFYRIVVRDHGEGIPKAFHSRIFQRFAQADSSDTRKKGGTGLGLSITKAIVERHHGQINYTTAQGQGTDFYFDIPAIKQKVTASQTEIGMDKRVLICEDNADVANTLKAMLNEESVQCDIANNTAVAKTLLSQQQGYHLLLLDLVLPDKDGLQFLQELRADTLTADLPVIVISGQVTGQTAFNGEALTVIDWIQKPIDPQHLRKALHQALQQEHKPHILHIEDDNDIVQITKIVLQDLALFSHAASLSGARQLLKTESFDLIILDIALPDGSGLDLLEELRSCCPVVIFSAQIPSSEIATQVSAALTKSKTSNEQLIHSIKKILDRHPN